MTLWDEEMFPRHVEHPYFLYLTGEELFRDAGALRPLVDGALAPAHRQGTGRSAFAGETLQGGLFDEAGLFLRYLCCNRSPTILGGSCYRLMATPTISS
ncbi:MAG: hypothetical protein EOQ96_15195 [Mesorhizobium sp.]|nr:MAG: hypothetical protein EOQ96_15195 [Mesorhizobium sp.]